MAKLKNSKDISSFDYIKVKSALLKKGFKLDNTHNHHGYYFFYLNGEQTKVFTYMSHNQQEIDSYLIKRMSQQLRISKDQFKKLILCTLSEDQYIDILKNLNLI